MKKILKTISIIMLVLTMIIIGKNEQKERYYYVNKLIENGNFEITQEKKYIKFLNNNKYYRLSGDACGEEEYNIKLPNKIDFNENYLCIVENTNNVQSINGSKKVKIKFENFQYGKLNITITEKDIKGNKKNIITENNLSPSDSEIELEYKYNYDYEIKVKEQNKIYEEIDIIDNLKTSELNSNDSEIIRTIKLKSKISSEQNFNLLKISEKIIKDTMLSNTCIEWNKSYLENTNGEDYGLYYYKNNDKITYFYRGATAYNYVKFGGYIWKIIRINEDGSVRMILDGDIGSTSWNDSSKYKFYTGYTYGNINYQPSAIENASEITIYDSLNKNTSTNKITYYYSDNYEIVNGLYKLVNPQKIEYDSNTFKNFKSILKDKYVLKEGSMLISKKNGTSKEMFKISELYWSNSNSKLKGQLYKETVYTYINSNNNFSNPKKILDSWYKSKLKKYDNYISTSTFCNDTSGKAYERLARDNNPTFDCNGEFEFGGKYIDKIGLISADEMVFAGAKVGKINNRYYLAYNKPYWTMTSSSNTSMFTSTIEKYDKIKDNETTYNINALGTNQIDIKDIKNSNADEHQRIIMTYSGDTSFVIRPVINIKGDSYVIDNNVENSNIIDGTKENPYEIITDNAIIAVYKEKNKIE